MAFPRIIFGRCPRCGNKGKDDDDASSAFSTEDHAGDGYNLDYYNG